MDHQSGVMGRWMNGIAPFLDRTLPNRLSTGEVARRITQWAAAGREGLTCAKAIVEDDPLGVFESMDRSLKDLAAQAHLCNATHSFVRPECTLLSLVTVHSTVDEQPSMNVYMLSIDIDPPNPSATKQIYVGNLPFSG